MKKTSLVQITKKDQTVFPAGTLFNLTFENNRIVATTDAGARVVLNAGNGQKYFGAPFTKAPSLATMERWGNDGVAKTVTGKRTECDGHGDDGSPSWLLVLNLI